MTISSVIRKIRLDRIVPNPAQARKTFDSDSLISLGESIKMHGLAQAIGLVKVSSNNELARLRRQLESRLQGFDMARSDDPLMYYGDAVYARSILLVEKAMMSEEGFVYLIDWGERRFRGSLMVGQTTIRAEVKEGLDEHGRDMLMIVENRQRQDVHPIEEAESFRRLIDDKERHWPEVESESARIGCLAAELSVRHADVSDRLKLLDLIPEAREYDLAGYVTNWGRWELATMTPDQQVRMLRLMKAGKLPTCEKIMAAAKAIRNPPPEQPTLLAGSVLQKIEAAEGAKSTAQVAVNALTRLVENELAFNVLSVKELEGMEEQRIALFRLQKQLKAKLEERLIAIELEEEVGQ